MKRIVQLSTFKFQYKNGVTIIELLIVISLVSIVAASTTPFLSRFIVQNDIEVATDNVNGYLRKAQIYSMDGKNDSQWGTCITGSQLRLYTGSCTLPIISENYTIPQSISISGLTDVLFSKSRGEPSTGLIITISSSYSTRQITLNEAGGFNKNTILVIPTPTSTPASIPNPCPTQADCLNIDTSSANIAGGGDRELQGLLIQRTDVQTITVTTMTVSWTEPGRTMQNIRIDGSNLWTGNVSSGTLVDITDYVPDTVNKNINRLRFFGDMSGSSFTLQFTMGDGSTKSVIITSPPDG